MQSISRKIVLVKLSVVFVAVILAAFGFTKYSGKYHKVDAASSGPSPSYTNAPNESNCTVCHADFPVNSGTGNVALNGVPANYLPNQAIPLTVTVSQSDGVLYGFQMTAIDSSGNRIGTYTIPAQNPAQLQVVSGLVGQEGFDRRYIEHTSQGITPSQFGSKSWNFTWNAPNRRVGKISFYIAGNAANSDGSSAGDYIYTNSKATLSGTAISNFDTDGKSDVSVFRPSNGVWYSLNSTNGNFTASAFGTTGDKPTPADFDGDGRTDTAVFRPSNGTWYVQRSTAGFTAVTFGQNGDIPVAGDYDGDLKADFAVFRPSNSVWYYLRSSDGAFAFQPFGSSGDKVAQGDYDADGKTDFAVFRPSNGTWYAQRSTAGFTAVQFGQNGDRSVQGDYDGDGRTDVAVFRPSNGAWYILGSTRGFSAVTFGQNGDVPVPADFDGDGKTDVAVFRGGNWYGLRSTDNSFFAVNFGLGTDIPTPSAYLAE